MPLEIVTFSCLKTRGTDAETFEGGLVQRSNVEERTWALKNEVPNEQLRFAIKGKLAPEIETMVPPATGPTEGTCMRITVCATYINFIESPVCSKLGRTYATWIGRFTSWQMQPHPAGPEATPSLEHEQFLAALQ